MGSRKNMNDSDGTYVIGLDLGTSAIKGVVADAAGTVCVAADAKTVYTHPHEGWVEANAEQWLADVFGVIRDLNAKAPGPVRALAFAAASGNALLTEADGTPLTPVINWMDQRCVGSLPPSLQGLTVPGVRQITGWPCIDSFPLAQFAWLREHRAADFARAAHICMNTDWLMYRLSGQWVMDHSTATTSHLQDQVTKRYHSPYLERIGISATKLSRLERSGVTVGSATPATVAATGLPVDTQIVTGCFDHPAAARAVDVTQAGQLMLSCGTSWVGFFPEPNRQKIVDAELLCDPFLSEDAGPWGAIFSVPYIGQAVDAYVRDMIAPNARDPHAMFDRLAAEAPAGANGLIIDLREAVQPTDASPADLSRAVMESAARLLNEKLVALREHGFAFEKAVMVGGPSKSPIWPSIVADITGLEMHVGSPSAGAQGAAMLAAGGLERTRHLTRDPLRTKPSV